MGVAFSVHLTIATQMHLANLLCNFRYIASHFRKQTRVFLYGLS